MWDVGQFYCKLSMILLLGTQVIVDGDGEFWENSIFVPLEMRDENLRRTPGIGHPWVPIRNPNIS